IRKYGPGPSGSKRTYARLFCGCATGSIRVGNTRTNWSLVSTPVSEIGWLEPCSQCTKPEPPSSYDSRTQTFHLAGGPEPGADGGRHGGQGAARGCGGAGP